MKIMFKNLNPQFEKGMAEFLKKHSFVLSDDGIKITVTKSENEFLKISKSNNEITFEIPKENLVFRCLTLIKDKFSRDSFVITEKCYFDTFGVMFDGSQANSLMNIKAVKSMLLNLAGMGYNMMMLYCEDCYELDNEPYWGNMRPKYMKKDFIELDLFADSLGIELIPCIQTLGHLPEAIKHPRFRELSDTKTILEVGNPKVYDLIERILIQTKETFKTRRIHVGLDEAWDLGLGRYLSKNGYRKKSDIMRDHLEKIGELCEKHGFKPMMWSDMFFRAKAKNGLYYEKVEFNDDDRKSVPHNMDLVYWDYYFTDKEHYEMMIKQHKTLSDKILFAGAVGGTLTYGGDYTTPFANTKPALETCKKEGIKNVFVTSWGDDQSECSKFATLPALVNFAEQGFSETVENDKLKERFKDAVCADFDDFAYLDLFDIVPDENGVTKNFRAISRGCMWQDILMGKYDKSIEEFDLDNHYAELEKTLSSLSGKYNEFESLFRFYTAVARVLKTKSKIGIKIKKYYDEKNLKELEIIKNEVLPALYEDTKALHIAHRNHFFEIYKPIGWEIFDIRYGGVISRIETAISRLDSYLKGEVDVLDELEEERLPFDGGRDYTYYQKVCSASSL